MPHDQEADDSPRVHTETTEQPRAEEAEEPRETEEPAPVAGPDTAAPRADGGEERMFQPEDADRFRTQWQRIQAGFVDDPREAVRSANELLSEALRSLTAAVGEMEGQVQQGSGEQTEDMRQALRRYRSVLNQLLDT